MKNLFKMTTVLFLFIQTMGWSQTETKTITSVQETNTTVETEKFKDAIGSFLLEEAGFELKIVQEDDKMYIITEFSKDILVQKNLGPNGAGKSTLLKMIATTHKPTEGLISLNKNNILKDPNYMRKQLGFLPQDFGVYHNLNAVEFLTYIAALKGVGGPQLQTRILELLEGLNLMAVAKKPIGSYSGGMKQRVGIAQTLLNNPKIVIFDEPTVGLDPEERVRFRNLISELANECIVILSSHIVSDIDTIADQVAILKNAITQLPTLEDAYLHLIKKN